MRVRFAVVGGTKPQHFPYMDLSEIPRQGDTVTLPGLDVDLQSVRTVVWYPMGDPDDEEPDNYPFVYIVLGPQRT